MQCFTRAAFTTSEKNEFHPRFAVNSGSGHTSSKSWSIAPGHSVCLKEYVEDSYYARFMILSYHNCREIYFDARLRKLMKIATGARYLGQPHKAIMRA